MKFSKLALLPLIALGLMACTPTIDNTGTTPAPETSNPNGTEVVGTEWDETTKQEMIRSFGFVIPYFHVEGGEWFNDPDVGFTYSTDPEQDLTEEIFINNVLVPMIQGGLVDNTSNYTFKEDIPGLERIILAKVEVTEAATTLNNILLVYAGKNAFGAGTGGGLMITAGPSAETYTEKEISDETQAALVKEAFGPDCTLKLPSLASWGKQNYVIAQAAEGIGLMVLLGYCGTPTNVAEIAAIYAEAGWVVNANDKVDYAFDIYDNAEDPQWMGIIAIFPDMSIRVIINPFSIGD